MSGLEQKIYNSNFTLRKNIQRSQVLFPALHVLIHKAVRETHDKKSPSTGNPVSMLNCPITTSIETSRKLILNPLSHSQLINVYEQELNDAIAAVADLRTEIQNTS